MSTRPGPAADRGGVAADAEKLVAGLLRDPWGRVAPSVYESARLITLAPWLTGHAERLRFVLAAQRADGGWGPPGGYALVPTLSAVESLLTVLRADEAGSPPAVRRTEVLASVERALVTLGGWLGDEGPNVPDTPAVDLIVPALVEAINVRLDRLPADSLTPQARTPLGLPRGMGGDRLVGVRRLIASGARVPAKLAHSFEVVGAAAGAPPGVGPGRLGTVGASPAATAAWIAVAGAARGARSHLRELALRQGGPVPCPIPITVFERAWVSSGLARVGIPLRARRELVESLTAALGPTGASTGPGLPTDADTTSVTLYALGHLGAPVAPESLWGYDTGGHFATWPGEDGASVTTNAHVLDAFGQHLATRPAAESRYAAVVHRLSGWLRDQQRADGAWHDRWHASPYYATACAVLALHEYGRGPALAQAVDRAVDWVLGSQRPDGSWGRWSGTAEETAYALHVLLGLGRSTRGRLAEAVRGGRAYLRRTAGRQPQTALWHGKELYAPAAIVESVTLAALHLAASRAELESSAAPF
ncbi:prenyltransferase/squalene oxidase-like repeat protein [Micromonospora pisi]|uniref:Prenyltransferase/squalene oxidase-like repeat protein n=1 Tax=Micromonospora pisi TaxID=589240 RepID=A0A495JBW7_9ACTN|nr:prenyltransferase/squalene oxidase repeat-containing protein [Micromonospora pisi]RKR86405.1 prenyltransferase/squalene oxidase-like repeat protein [Micromonospora pisi]